MTEQSQPNQGTVVVFRIQLLPPSETFIVTQAAAMRRFSPYFVGWRRMAGIELPRESSWTADGGGIRGKFRELCFRYSGPSRTQLGNPVSSAPVATTTRCSSMADGSAP